MLEVLFKTQKWLAMEIRYNDGEIAAFISEPKQLPDNYMKILLPDAEKCQNQRTVDITGNNGYVFRIFVKKHHKYEENFSIGFGVKRNNSKDIFILKRYNCKQQHTNFLESETIFGYHIHTATQRYQEIGRKSEGYAEQTTRYNNALGALKCLIADCNFKKPPVDQYELFEVTA